MSFFLKIFGVLILLIIGGIFAAYTYLPWKIWLADQIKIELAAKGLENVDFKIDTISSSRITLADIRFGANAVLHSLAIEYDPREVIGGHFKELVISNLMIEAKQTAGVWAVDGFAPADNSSSVMIPDDDIQIRDIPLDRLDIKSSTIMLETEQWRLDFPFDFAWDKEKKTIQVSGASADFAYDKMKFHALKTIGEIGFRDSAWQGNWEIDGISLEGFPDLSAKGIGVIKERKLNLEGDINAVDGSAKASFALVLSIDEPDTMRLSIKDTVLKWGQGIVRIKKAEIPLDGKGKTKLILDVEKVNLQDLLRVMTGQEITASGTVSGKIPVIFAPDGSIGLEKSHMSANGKGLVSVPSTLIPGEGEQIDLTRQVLQDFSYDGLSVDVQEEANGRVSILLNVSGNNPKVYDGRAVKLNVRLGGDVLEFLQSNIMMLMKPESILDQEKK